MGVLPFRLGKAQLRQRKDCCTAGLRNAEGSAISSEFRGTLVAAQKGASGPRKGQKSTLLENNLFSELTFSPQDADLGTGKEVRHAG